MEFVPTVTACGRIRFYSVVSMVQWEGGVWRISERITSYLLSCDCIRLTEYDAIKMMTVVSARKLVLSM
jgi:hypothetical protein